MRVINLRVRPSSSTTKIFRFRGSGIGKGEVDCAGGAEALLGGSLMLSGGVEGAGGAKLDAERAPSGDSSVGVLLNPDAEVDGLLLFESVDDGGGGTTLLMLLCSNGRDEPASERHADG